MGCSQYCSQFISTLLLINIDYNLFYGDVKMNILSLFDGISAARLALINSKISVENYYSSEIDEYCQIVSKNAFPDIIPIGDVRNIDIKTLPKIDLLIGGSPCQDLSHAHKGTGLDGARSSLFYEFVKIKDILKPKYFILENVMNKWKKLMDETLGEEGIVINSKYYSAQYRPRCYWSNIPIKIPKKEFDCSVIDILEKNPDNKYFINNDLLKNYDGTNQITNRQNGIIKIYDIPRDLLKDNERQRRVYSVYGKSPTLLARSDTAKFYHRKFLRKLTPLECERLQGLPDNYTANLSMTQRYKAIGNSFTVPVISSILNNIGNTKNKQLQFVT